MERKMTSNDVISLYTQLENLDIKIYIDGGWSVDALLGIQTREHNDLDIALQYKDEARFREYLEKQGYKEIERADESKWNFVLGDDKGHEIDVHCFTFDKNNKVIQGIEYPEGSLTGEGVIDGHIVRCINPLHLIKFHSGYELKEKDFKDVIALCEKFKLEVPEEYKK